MSTTDQYKLKCPILLPTGRDANLVGDTCERHGITTVRCNTLNDLLETVEQSSGPVVIANDALKQAQWQRLKDWFENQPEWSELPLLILTRQGHDTAPLAFFNKLRGATLLPRPLAEDTLVGVLQVGLESRHRQYQARDLLAQLREANRELDNRTRQLQHLALVLTKAEEAERRRIAHILHDELQQLIAAARVALRRMLPRNGETDTTRKETFDKVDSVLQEAIDASRDLSHELSPPLLYHGGLGPALDQLADNMQNKYGIKIETAWDDKLQDMDNTLRSFLFESARELVFNAYKHADSKSVVLQLRSHHHLVSLSVEDQGKGFEVDEAFKSGQPSAKTGLGLFGIREQAEILGGTFAIDSKAEQGTRITLTVPRQIADDDNMQQTQEQADSNDQDAETAESTGAPPIRILVVDDHRIMREGLVSMLSEVDGFEVVGEADDGATAFAKAQELKPDIVLMDVSLPDMNGIRVTRTIRAELPDTEVIGLSMFEEDEIARQMIEAGASSYLVKSGPTESLVSAIRACLPCSARAGSARGKLQ